MEYNTNSTPTNFFEQLLCIYIVDINVSVCACVCIYFVNEM